HIGIILEYELSEYFNKRYPGFLERFGAECPSHRRYSGIVAIRDHKYLIRIVTGHCDDGAKGQVVKPVVYDRHDIASSGSLIIIGKRAKGPYRIGSSIHGISSIHDDGHHALFLVKDGVNRQGYFYRAIFHIGLDRGHCDLQSPDAIFSASDRAFTTATRGEETLELTPQWLLL